MINRKHLKAMLFAGFLGVMTLASTVPSMAATGWNKVDNQWVYYDSSGNLRKGWLGTSDGAYYYMDQSSGKMTTGWKKIDNKWYFFRPDGTMVASSWITDQGKFYYLYENGTMVTGWLKIGNDYYYLKSSGAMTTGWWQISIIT